MAATGRLGELLRSTCRDGAEARRELRADVFRETLLGNTAERLDLQWLDVEVVPLLDELAARHRTLGRRKEVWAACQKRQVAAWQAKISAAEATAANASALAEDLRSRLDRSEGSEAVALEEAANMRAEMRSAAKSHDRELDAKDAATARLRHQIIQFRAAISALAAILLITLLSGR